ncbi:MAG: hypothetical protein RR841_07005 [Eubacterium sp.]
MDCHNFSLVSRFGAAIGTTRRMLVSFMLTVIIRGLIRATTSARVRLIPQFCAKRRPVKACRIM